MSLARKVFLWIFGSSLALGLLIGTANLLVPGAVSVELNGKQVEGMIGFWTALMSGGIPGLILGLIGGGVTKVFSRTKPASD